MQSFTKEALFAGNLVKTTNVGSYTGNIAFHQFCSVWQYCVVASFLSVENWTSIKYRFFLFLFFCNRFHTNGL